eukprot:SAG11_NODE_3006_length_2773_cov_2.627524_4_plen_103_part_00
MSNQLIRSPASCAWCLEQAQRRARKQESGEVVDGGNSKAEKKCGKRKLNQTNALNSAAEHAQSKPKNAKKDGGKVMGKDKGNIKNKGKVKETKHKKTAVKIL